MKTKLKKMIFEVVSIGRRGKEGFDLAVVSQFPQKCSKWKVQQSTEISLFGLPHVHTEKHNFKVN